MRKWLLLLLLLVTGCTSDNINNDIGVDIKVDDVYVDNNVIRLGLFPASNNYHNKERIDDVYYADFNSMVDIGSFEVFLTDDKVIDGNGFKDTWYKYYDMYDDISNYKVGFNISYTLYDGSVLGGNLLEPDNYRFGEHFYTYLYDDVNAPSGFYSHLESMDDDTILSSIKLFAVSGIDKVESITLTAFTYDDDDFLDGVYRGKSKYSIIIKRK